MGIPFRTCIQGFEESKCLVPDIEIKFLLLVERILWNLFFIRFASMALLGQWIDNPVQYILRKFENGFELQELTPRNYSFHICLKNTVISTFFGNNFVNYNRHIYNQDSEHRFISSYSHNGNSIHTNEDFFAPNIIRLMFPLHGVIKLPNYVDLCRSCSPIPKIHFKRSSEKGNKAISTDA